MMIKVNHVIIDEHFFFEILQVFFVSNGKKTTILYGEMR